MASPSGTHLQLSRPWRRPILCILLWLLLAVPIARAQLAEIAVADDSPARALRFDASHARALSALAEALQLKGEQQTAMALARASLKREPMNVVALRTLGFALEEAGDKAGADRILFLAGRLGWRDVALQIWLVKAYALRNDYRASLRRADALARTNELPDIIYPLFLASITDPDLRKALVHEMADRPKWRGIFFYRLMQLPPEQMTYFDELVADLARAGSAVTPPERAIYLNRLVQVGQGAKAYAYWLREQNAEGVHLAGVPWDSAFEHLSAAGALAAPFEWQLSAESAGVASLVPAGHGQQLFVSPGHDFNGTLLAQTVVLGPGAYRLTAQVQGDAAAAGLRWTIRCLPGQNELGQVSGPEEAEFATAMFAVPKGCTAQTLSIDMASSDDASNGGVTIGDIRIRRMD